MLQLLWIHVHAISVSQPGKRLPNGTQMITISSSSFHYISNLLLSKI